MKKPILAAIFTSLALNVSVGGWHDSAPYVAWPATNHLRWVDNVGVYTNQAVWTNSGYGAWTNNYYLSTSNWYTDPLRGKTNFFTPFFSKLPLRNGVLSNALLNAKDTRIEDCINACYERYRAVSSANTYSNFYIRFSDFFQDKPDVWIPRSEAVDIQLIKDFIRVYLMPYYYYPNDTLASMSVHTESSLCARASCPTNFLRYTPSRAADGSWKWYGAYYSNSYFLANTGIYELVTSSGKEIQYTNATPINTVVIYSTNTNILATATLNDYGWDSLRRIITNLNITKQSVSWLNTVETNYSGSTSSNFAYQTPSYLLNPEGASPGQPIDFDTAIACAIASNSFLPYTTNYGKYREWDLSSCLTNPVVTNKAGIAPISRWYGVYGESQFYNVTYITYGQYIDGVPCYYLPFDYPYHDEFFGRYDFNVGDGFYTSYISTNRISNLVYSNDWWFPIDRSIVFSYSCGSTNLIIGTNYLASGDICTTSDYCSAYLSPSQSASITNFGYTTLGFADASGGGGAVPSWVTNTGGSVWWTGVSPEIPGNIAADAVFGSFYGAIMSSKDKTYTNQNGISSELNIKVEASKNDSAVIWDFEYK